MHASALRYLRSYALLGVLIGLAGVGFLRFGLASAAPQTYEGDLEITHTDDFAHGHATFAYRLKTSSGTFDVQFADHHPAVPAAKRVKLQGQKDGKAIKVAAGAKVVAADGSGSGTGGTVAAVTGSKRVAVILIKFSATQTEPYTPTTAAGVAFNNSNSVAAYYNEVSYGQLSLSGDVFGWWTVTGDTSACNYTAWSNAADQYAAANGFDLSSYNYRVYAFPSVSACGWAGLAYLPGTRSYLNGSGGMTLRVMSHELGHNLGTHHASTISCTENSVRVAIPVSEANCVWSEYGDPFTVMGASSVRHTSNFSLGNFGWLTPANTQDVTVGGTYSLTAADDPSTTAVKTLRIPRPSGEYLVLELRKPYGQYFDNFGPTDPAVTGVSIRIAPGYSIMNQSRLVDATPATATFSDAPLPVGASTFDPASLATVSVVSVGNGVATVAVSFVADTTAPSTPTNLQATPLSPTQVRLNWGASTDDRGVAGYEVRRGGVLLTTTTSLTFTDSGLTGNTAYAYTVTARDAAGNLSSSATVSVTTPTPDTQAPSQPANLVAKLLTKPSRVALTWSSSTDNVGVTGYRVLRNGKVVASPTTTAYTDRPGRGTWTYTVVALDAAGNVSPASASVTVTVR